MGNGAFCSLFSLLSSVQKTLGSSRQTESLFGIDFTYRCKTC
jgi:hypothetical protein